ncbi:cyclophane-forming radical SAM/SPASM peptide maturase YhhB [Mesorhizobium opportunistum]|uniref:Radical SAM domain protein n=1 Tax=Mesorhizobium opportunistum (strain LMG 24607 / HAMBI 3007 / WSM2075) TaxID=536019 RepID=F7Y9X2_MESOW|nr:cyclophane-forming radical SAM/SPASM peptide maturase YhhB [Mesorhizobium opportunistum]AEH89911.1 Radical SAM domain protein [Mesorhizobium opportunistum WSM2075]
MTSQHVGSRQLDTVLLKVASRCNLDCSYCYIYHMGDEAWRSQPKQMSDAVIQMVAQRLSDQLALQAVPFSVVLHGGEPLLLGATRLEHFCATLRGVLPHPCGIHIQTNGALISDRIIDVLVRYDVGVSVSIDGPQAVHDRFRLDHRGKGSFARVRAGVERLMAREDSRALLAGVLAVIDPDSNPAEVYAALKQTGAMSFDVLPRDGNWDKLPFGKRSAKTIEYGIWLEGLLDVYLADPHPPTIRLLDDILRLLLGGRSMKEGVGTADYGILVIEPDGTIEKNDTLKVAGAGADRFDQRWSVFDHSFNDVFGSDEFSAYYHQQRPISAICASCPDLAVCGGGMVAHRWSAERGYDNPSIFCADQRHLIARMRRVVEAAERQEL